MVNDTGENDPTSTANKQIEDKYINNTFNGSSSSIPANLENETLYKIVTYHPSTASNGSRQRQRTRHYSQPGMTDSRPSPRRPARSMITMEDMIYDPLRREFRRKTTTGDGNERRTIQDANEAQRFSNSNGRLSPDTSEGAKNVQRFASGDRLNIPYDNSDSLSINDSSGYIYRTSSVGNRSGGNRSAGNRSNRQNKISVISVPMFEDYTQPSSSTEAEKRKMFRSTLTTILSCMYAILLLTLGVIIFFSDIFIESPISEIYCLYLIAVGFVYLGFLLVDIRIYINKAKKYHMDKVNFEEANFNDNNNNEVLDDFSTSLPNKAPSQLPQHPQHDYCFTTGRHAGSFFLKMGAAGFCLLHLVHSGLFLYAEAVFLSSDLDDDCGSVTVLVLYIIYPIYSFCQLFFIFKYSNVIILKLKGLGRFALMHCIGSSLCFWVWTIIRETLEALKIYARKSANKPDDKMYPWEEYEIFDKMKNVFNITPLVLDNCTVDHNLDGMVENVFPYLYPFTIEYSILIVGIFYILWSNIGNCNRDNEYMNEPKDDWCSYKSSNETEQCKPPTAIDDNGLVSNLTINIDCHSSNKGWFGGMLILVMSIVSVVVTYVAITNKDHVTFGVMLKDSMEMFINLAMLVAVLVAYYQIRKLDVNLHPISKLDDLLLFICIPAFFIDASFTLVPAVIYSNYVKMFCVLVVCIQVMVQTPFIIDALRRCSNSRELRRSKPGRELITFLIVCNVSCWIFETISIKNADTDDERYDFYGKVLWTILGHISLPLSMFYRFHSSVCLADIWKAAYAPGNKH